VILFRPVAFAALVATASPATADTITLLCRGDAFAPSLGGTEVVESRVVIDPVNKSLLVRQNGTSGIVDGPHDYPSSDDPNLVWHCDGIFIESNSSYAANQQCHADYLQRHWSTAQEWAVDRVTGHLTYNWRSMGVSFAKTAECSPIDAHPKF
jgi:hypothetical protein